MLFLEAVLKMSISAGILGVAVLIMRPFIRKKLPCITLMILWGVVWTLFLLPIRVPSPTSVYNLVNESVTYNAIAMNITTSESINIIQNESNAINFMNITLLVWLCGVVITLVCFISLNFKLYKKYNNAVLWSDSKIIELTKGLKRNVNVYISNNTDTPVSYGIFKPKIILPQSAICFDKVRLEHIICHEMQHIRHFHSLMNLLWLFIICLHWFNPLAWISWTFFRKDIEFYCDTQVINDIGFHYKADYAQTLLNMTSTKKVYTLSLGFNSSMVGKRIRSILSFRNVTPLAWIGTGVIIILVIISFATSGIAAKTVNDIMPPQKTIETTATNSIQSDTGYIYFDITKKGKAENDKINIVYTNCQSFENKEDLENYIAKEFDVDISKSTIDNLKLNICGYGIGTIETNVVFTIDEQTFAVNTKQGTRNFVIMEKASYKGDISLDSAVFYLGNGNFSFNNFNNTVLN